MIFYDPILVLLLLIIYFSSNKKRALILFTISSMETNLKKILAVVYAEPRPFMLGNIDECFCIYGHPSGHLSGFVSFYFFIFYYYVMGKRLKIYWQFLIGLILAFLLIWLSISRFFFASHFIN